MYMSKILIGIYTLVFMTILMFPKKVTLYHNTVLVTRPGS